VAEDERDLNSDMYVFARDTDPELVRNGPKDPDGVIRYYAQLTGDYSSFAVIESDGVEVQRIANDLFAPPGSQMADPDTSKPILSGKAVVKRSLWLNESALIRIGAMPGRAEEVLERLDDAPGYSASSIVLGNYDILLELSADTRQDLFRHIRAVTHFDGIAWSRTHLVLDWWHRDHEKPTG
jgi:hypothetical protein